MIPFFLSCARHSGGRQTSKAVHKAVQARDMQLLKTNKEGNYFLTATNMIEN